ncbi:hypothetical protein B0H63DRAFT_480744 [Podospora didyma]|uniref:Uncharacterized protein n=1 Tax=Podospora didyma TaxID=330526 RepID=A0AAE0KEH6_9PEZI|nr:hypothetical protein B0H63DRAFT_480744 [Podospora didyma]
MAREYLDAQYSPSNGADHLPPYQPPSMGSRDAADTYSRATPRSSAAGSAGDRPERDSRGSYALALQKTCSAALQRVKSNNVIANTNWAAPLAAAPSAISTMAILLKAADLKAAAGLEVETQDVIVGDGAPAGRLPSKYFHTNLQYCSDMGKIAFRDAQHGMNTIRKTAQSMIAPEGSIACIVDLLEDPEDARYNLKPEIAAVKKTANKCLDNAKAITAKFEYWHLVIMHLHQTSLSKRGEIVKEREETGKKKIDADQDKKKYENLKDNINATIKDVSKRLREAEGAVDRAQAEVEWLRYQPVVPEQSVFEDIAMARRAVPHTPAPAPRDRGLFTAMKDGLFGQSDSHRQQDEDARRAHAAEIQKMENAILEQAREQHKRQLDAAANRLRAAKEDETRLSKELDDAREKLNESRYHLAEAKANLEAAKGEFKMLENKELELDGIMLILENSTKELATLKEKVEPLVEFFQNILGEIDHNVDINLEAFLRPIENGIKEGTNPDEVEALNVSRRSKKNMMSTALQMQGRFSAIADISTAYVTVSTDYILPAITRMERLSILNDSQWAIESDKFVKDCDGWMMEIDGVAARTSASVDRNMADHMQALQTRAIEAAAENDE